MPDPQNIWIRDSILIKGEQTPFIKKVNHGIIESNAKGLTLNTLTVPLVTRIRDTIAEVNTGKDLIGAQAGLKFRLYDVKVIAIGGALAATAAATGLAIYGTQGGSQVALFTVLLAAATQSTICYPGLANTSVLADGVSFVACDAGTATSIKAVSAGDFDLITATHIDIIMTYTLEA